MSVHVSGGSLMLRALISTTIFALALAAGVPSSVASAQRPVIERLEPRFGPPGTVVRLFGRSLPRSTQIEVGGQAAEVSARLPYRIHFVLPEGVSGPAEIVVITPAGRFRGPEVRVTEAAPPPIITALEPAEAAPGAEVVIRGERFGADPRALSVTVGGAPAIIRAVIGDAIYFRVPAGCPGGVVRVTRRGAGAADGPALALRDGARISAISPAIAPIGARVTIRGSGFGDDASRVRVFLRHRRVPVARVSPTELEVEVPEGAVSAPFVVALTGHGRVQSPGAFEVQQPPQLRAVTPEAGTPGVEVVLEGEHLGAAAGDVSVRLGEVPVEVLDVTPTQVRVRLPAEEVTSGAFAVEVHGMAAEGAPTFRVLAAVSIAALHPAAGPPSTLFRIRGDGFGDTPEGVHVWMGGVRAQVVAVRPTEIVARVPRVSGGAVRVHIPRSGCSARRASRASFRARPPPTAS